MAGALRLNRDEIRARLPGFDPAVMAELADAYEQTALAAMEAAREAASRRLGKPAEAAPRRRQPEESDDG